MAPIAFLQGRVLIAKNVVDVLLDPLWRQIRHCQMLQERTKQRHELIAGRQGLSPDPSTSVANCSDPGSSVHRMTEWYRGVNPQAHLPHLAAYLGHRDIHSTLVYLTITDADGRLILTLQGAGPLEDVAFSPTGSRLASADSNGTVHVWDESGPSKSPPTGSAIVSSGSSGMATETSRNASVPVR